MISHIRGRRETVAAERDEATGGWRELHNQELHNLNFTCYY
jgi:hypothetical protein